MMTHALRNKSGNPESLRNNHSSWKTLQLMCTWLGSTNCFIYGFVLQGISEKKNCVAKILQGT